jgi:hypothetical protein
MRHFFYQIGIVFLISAVASFAEVTPEIDTGPAQAALGKASDDLADVQKKGDTQKIQDLEKRIASLEKAINDANALNQSQNVRGNQLRQEDPGSGGGSKGGGGGDKGGGGGGKGAEMAAMGAMAAAAQQQSKNNQDDKDKDKDKDSSKDSSKDASTTDTKPPAAPTYPTAPPDVKVSGLDNIGTIKDSSQSTKDSDGNQKPDKIASLEAANQANAEQMQERSSEILQNLSLVMSKNPGTKKSGSDASGSTSTGGSGNAPSQPPSTVDRLNQIVNLSARATPGVIPQSGGSGN